MPIRKKRRKSDSRITKIAELKRLSDKTKNELIMLSEIINAIMQSLDLNQVIYTILTALTSRDGLGFDRAMFFLVNDQTQTLDGKMAIGPHSAAEADKVWHKIDKEEMTLSNLIRAYEKFKHDPESKLNHIVKGISIPLKEEMGILALTILEGMPFEVKTQKAKSMVNKEIAGLLNTDFFVTIPLKTKNRTLGAILVDNISSREVITKDSVRILTMFADHAALAIENSRLYERTVHLSRTDWLTGLWNARHFYNVLEMDIKRAVKEKESLSLLMIDIDNFKIYNDALGHPKGDEAIKKVAFVLYRFSRKIDFISRYGGEEFCVIMSDTSKDDAKIIAERLRRESENAFKVDETVPEELKLTVSIGLATYPDDSKAIKEDLVRKADMALYYAKKSGKNRVSEYRHH